MEKNVYEFISDKTNDPIVEWKTCKISGQPFAIFQSDVDFYDKISPTFDGQNFAIPTPTLCPEERQRRRLMFRNERKLYKRTCNATGKDIVSIYSPDKPYQVYDQQVRRSDSWNPMDYGRDFDFSRTFTENFQELNLAVPKQSLAIRESENCEYNNLCGSSKNCYMIFASSNNEDCFYSKNLSKSVDSMDILIGENLTACYELIDCKNCNTVYFSKNTRDSSFSSYLENCIDCQYCYGCNNLSHKMYCMHNQQYTKEEYMDKIASLQKTMWGWEQDRQDIIANVIIESTNAYGNNIRNSSNAIFVYDSRNIEDSKYIYESYICKSSYDQTYCDNEQGYECLGGNSYHSLFSMPIGGSEIFYSITCFDCDHLFGCIGLRNKSYCVFNKQYSPEDYNKKVSQIISHMQTTREWGEFLDPELSHFGYNETVAHEYNPLTAEEAAKRGYKWQTISYDPVVGPDTEILTSDQIPSDISLVSDAVLKKVCICEISGRPFRLQKGELAFYRKHNLPLPRQHPDVRHAKRISMLPQRTLCLRHCDKCGSEMLSVYKELGTRKVYCETCYNKEIYG